MSLNAKILGLDQKVDFADGSISNVVRIELPGGAVVVALVTDEGAQQILTAVQTTMSVFKEQPSGTAPTVEPKKQIAFAPRPVEGVQPAVFEFGGNAVSGDLFDEEEDEPVVPPQLGPQLTRMRSLEADEAGNPIGSAGKPLYQETAPSAEESAMDEDGVRGL